MRLENRLKIFLLVLLAINCLPVKGYAYDSSAPLYVKRVDVCLEKPKGLGRFQPVADGTLRRGDREVFIYIELSNCKTRRKSNSYETSLAVDVAIYYEDGSCIFSEEEVSVFDYNTAKRDGDSYLWTKIDASYLKSGEYKVEMTVRDKNSKKEAFTLTKFKIL